LFKFAKDVIYEDSARVDITRKEHLNGFWFFCKRTEWSNEEEVRLVLPRRKGSKVKIDPTWLTRLILGKNMSEAHEHEIRKWAKELHHKSSWRWMNNGVFRPMIGFVL